MNQSKSRDRHRHGGSILAVMALLVCGLTLGACTPARPAVLRDLVALAPAGSNVTVDHVDDDLFGGYSAHWTWSFEAADPPSAIAAYRVWFAEQGIPLSVPGPDDEWPFPETNLSPAAGHNGPSVFVPVGMADRETIENGEKVWYDVEVPGTTVLGTLYDESIGPDGQLLR